MAPVALSLLVEVAVFPARNISRQWVKESIPAHIPVDVAIFEVIIKVRAGVEDIICEGCRPRSRLDR
jgi:hypothetical protein